MLLPAEDISHSSRAGSMSRHHIARALDMPIQISMFNLSDVLPSSAPDVQLHLTAAVGHEDSLSYTVEYLRKVNLKVLGKWSIPSRKTIKCGSRDIYERFIRSINRHIRSAGHQHVQQVDAGLDLGNVSALTILDAPYETEEQQRRSGLLTTSPE